MRKIQGFRFTRADTNILQCTLLSGYYGGLSLLNLSRINSKNMSWSPLLYKSIKINFDTAVLISKAAIGYVIKNSHRELIMAANKATALYLINYAEIMAA